jgi:type IV pilus assembly protein PilB
METPRIRLGELLVRAGLVTAEQLEEALAEQRRNGRRLGSLLVESGLVSETQVTQILSQQLSVPWVSLHHIDFSRDLLNLVPVDVVERYCLIPIYVRRVRGLGDALYIAMDDPTNAQALAEVAERSAMHVRAMIAPPSDILSAIRAYYGIGVEPVKVSAAIAPALAPVDDVEEDVPTGIHRSVVPAKLDAAVEDLIMGRTPSSLPPEARVPEPPIEIPPATVPVVARPEEAPASRGNRELNAAKPAGERARTAPVKPGQRRMIALTLLDGTTIRLPSKDKKGGAEPEPEPPAEPPQSQSAPEGGEDQLTARDLVSALRAAARGVDATEILGENAKWESMFAALLSLLLKKKIISDWEFVEEFKKS